MEVEKDPVVQQVKLGWQVMSGGIRKLISGITGIALVVCILLLGLYFWGATLDREQKVTRQLSCKINTKELHLILSDLKRYPNWRSDIFKVQVNTKNKTIFFREYFRKDKFLEYTWQRKGETIQIKLLSQSSRHTLLEKDQLDHQQISFIAHVNILIQSEQKGSKIEVTEISIYEGQVQRAFGRIFKGRRLDHYLNDLQKKCNS